MMESFSYYFDRMVVLFSIVGGWLAWVLGGYDLLLNTIIVMTVLDYITAIGSCMYSGKGLSSKKGFHGIIKKLFIYLTIVFAVVLEKLIGGAIPLREVVITFYIVNEGISILENIGKVVNYPDKLKEVLEQLRGD